MANENDLENAGLNDEFVSFDELEEKLQEQLDSELSDLSFLEEEKDKIGNPENLGNVIKDVVWEQFLNQIAATAGEDFIKENRGLTLDLRNEAHIQTSENFETENYATHNTYVDYKKRGDEYRSNFYTDKNEKPNAKQKQDQRYNEKTKAWEYKDTVDGEWKKSLKPDYREPYEDDRKKDRKNKFGSKTVNKDHQVADATIARDAEIGTYMTLDEKVNIANSDDNLYDLDSAANQSKSDHDGEKWVKHKRTGDKGKGQTNGEYFGIDEDEYIEQDIKAKEAIKKKIEKKKEEEIALGKKSQREEAFRIGDKALRAVVMQMLADLIKEIIGKLVKWFKSAKKELSTLLDGLKEAIHSFIGKMKTHLVNAGNTVFSTVATAITGPIFRTIKKVWTLLKQGWKSLKDAINYIKDPANKGKPISILLMEVGKIIIAGLTGVGALLLGEVIEKGLMTIPVFAFEIPFLGSLANILGIFLGAVVAGIIGAIALNLIDKFIAKRKKSEIQQKLIEQGNKVLNTQEKLIKVNEEKLDITKETVSSNIKERHEMAHQYMNEALSNIFNEDQNKKNDYKDEFDKMDKMLESLDF